MKRFQVNFSTQTPVALRAGREQSHSDTLGYVPGSALLGALAWAHQHLGRNKEEFAHWFLQGHVQVSNLYPTLQIMGKDKTKSDVASNPVLPMPLTARTCKRFDGFRYKADLDGEDRHGVRDALISLALLALTENKKPEVLAGIGTCNSCGQRMDDARGFYTRGALPEQVAATQCELALRTHVGIHSRTKAAARQVLYNRQVIPAETPFWGEWLAADDATYQQFEAFLADADDAGWLRLGTNRTRGLGCYKAGLLPVDDETDKELKGLHERITAFTALLKQQAAHYDIATPAAAYVPLTLTSDLLLLDVLLRPQLALTDETLLGLGLTGAHTCYSAAKAKRIEGWSDLWGLPKPDQLALGMGAVFVVALDALTDEACTRLLAWQTEGIGLRRAEGFGRLRVADSFHTDFFGEAK